MLAGAAPRTHRGTGALPFGEMKVRGPTNRFLILQRDRRWPRVLSAVLLVSGAVLVVLFLVGWPRLRCTSIHYELIHLRAEVVDLERRHHALSVELESERSPRRLALQAAGLGLVPATAPTMAETMPLDGAP